MKKAPKWAKPLLIISGIISAISLICFILLDGIFAPSFSMWFYYWQFEANNTYAQVAMEPEHLHEVARHMIDYMRGNVPDLQIYTYVAGEFRPFFSDIEIRHMVDVRDLAVFSIFLRNILLVLFAASFIPFIIFRKNIFRGKKATKSWGILFRSWRNGTVATAGLTAVLAIIISIDWDRAWYIFHEIIFTNEMFFGNRYWLLNPNVDLLINIVPAPFFITMSVFIALFFAVGLILVFIIATLLNKRSKLTLTRLKMEYKRQK
jgi:integral membrane protein (TIGR01906 family)